MFVSHMDGVGRAMTMMQLDVEVTCPNHSAAGSVRAAVSFPNWTKTDK